MDQFSTKFVAELKRRNSELLKHPVNEEYGAINIVISSPASGVPDITISSDDEEITIFFGPAHCHIPFLDLPLEDSVDEVETFVADLVSDEVVAYEARGAIFRLKTGGFAELDMIEKLRKKGRLIRAVSWSGEIIYGEHKET